MNSINATNLYRKSGVAQWRDLQFASSHADALFRLYLAPEFTRRMVMVPQKSRARIWTGM
jgi:hypothetical protein